MKIALISQKRAMVRAHLDNTLKPSPFKVTDDNTVIANLIIIKPGVVLSIENAREYPSAAIEALKKEICQRHRGMTLQINWVSLYEYNYIVNQLKETKPC